MKTPDIEKSRNNPTNFEESNFYIDFALSMDGKSVHIFFDEKDLSADLFETLRRAHVNEENKEVVQVNYFEITVSLLDEVTAASIKDICINKLALSFFRVFLKIPDDKGIGLGLAELLFQRDEQIMTLIEDDKFRVFAREKLPTGS